MASRSAMASGSSGTRGPLCPLSSSGTCLQWPGYPLWNYQRLSRFMDDVPIEYFLMSTPDENKPYQLGRYSPNGHDFFNRKWYLPKNQKPRGLLIPGWHYPLLPWYSHPTVSPHQLHCLASEIFIFPTPAWAEPTFATAGKVYPYLKSGREGLVEPQLTFH